MLVAEARVETQRPSRYLVQVCEHLRHVADAHPEIDARVEWSDERGVINFGWARCTLHADHGILTLRAEAADEVSLQRVQQRLAERLEQFGRRDHLTVTWERPHAPERTAADTAVRRRNQ